VNKESCMKQKGAAMLKKMDKMVVSRMNATDYKKLKKEAQKNRMPVSVMIRLIVCKHLESLAA